MWKEYMSFIYSMESVPTHIFKVFLWITNRYRFVCSKVRYPHRKYGDQQNLDGFFFIALKSLKTQTCIGQKGIVKGKSNALMIHQRTCQSVIYLRMHLVPARPMNLFFDIANQIVVALIFLQWNVAYKNYNTVFIHCSSRLSTCSFCAQV